MQILDERLSFPMFGAILSEVAARVIRFGSWPYEVPYRTHADESPTTFDPPDSVCK